MRFASRLLVVSLTVLAVLSACRPANAQVTGSQTQTFTTSVQNLIGFLQTTAGTDPTSQALVNDLQAQFGSLTADQINQMAANFDITAFSNAVNGIVNAQPSNRVQPPTDPPADLFQANFSICTLLEGQGLGPIQVPSDPAIIKPIDAAIEIAQTAKDIGDRLCDLIVVALGGTNAPGCIVAEVTDLILDGLQKARDVLTFCDAPVKTAETEATWRNTIQVDTDIATLGTNVANQLTSLANQLTQVDSDIVNHTSSTDTDVDANVAAVGISLANGLVNVNANLNNHITGVDTDLNTHLTQVDSDVTGGTTQVNNGLNTFQTLDVRLRIEQALSTGQTIGLFEVPAVQGGYLETVRAIVVDTINKVLASGGTVGNASRYLSSGDTAKAAGQFKSAYSDYASAYESAIH
jgi:hypothetical protein